jgi:hypothetical protein
MPESLVWSIFTQEVVVTKMKNPADSSENLLLLKWLAFQQQIPTHGL